MKVNDKTKTIKFGRQQIQIDDFFCKILAFEMSGDQNDGNKIHKLSIELYDCYYVCQYISTQVIEQLEKSQLNVKKGCSIIDFVRLMVSFIPHNDYENLFIVIALIDLFKEVIQTLQITHDSIKLKDLTEFICQKYTQIYKGHTIVDDIVNINNNKIDRSNYQAKEISFDTNTNLLCIATQKELIFINISNGRVQYTLNNLFNENEDEITVFKAFNFNKQAIIGNQRGQLSIYEMCNGEKISTLNGHQNEISHLLVDYQHKLILSVGCDFTLQVQSQNIHKFDITKKITNMNFQKIITIVEVSVHHNILITCSDYHFLYVWDYEFNRPIATLEMEQNQYPTFVGFINGLSLVLIGSSDGNVYVIVFEKTENKIVFRLLGILNIDKSLYLQTIDKDERKKWLQHNDQQQQQQKHQQRKHSITRVMTLTDSQLNFLTQNIVDQSIKANVQQNVAHQTAKRILIDCVIDNEMAQPQIRHCMVYLGLSKGLLSYFDLTEYITQMINTREIHYTEHANVRTNYNPYRISNENFLISQNKTKTTSFRINRPSEVHNVQKQFLTQSFTMVIPLHQDELATTKNTKIANLEQYIEIVVNAHSKRITILQLLKLDHNVLCTTSLDNQIKLWDYKTLTLLGQFNLTTNRTRMWNFNVNNTDLYRMKILYGLKVIEIIMKKYQNEITKDEERVLSLDKLLEKLFYPPKLQKPIKVTKEIKTSVKSQRISQLTQKTQKQELIRNEVDEQLIKKLISHCNKNIQPSKDDYESICGYLNEDFKNKILFPNRIPAELFNINEDEKTIKDVSYIIEYCYQRLKKKFRKYDKLLSLTQVQCPTIKLPQQLNSNNNISTPTTQLQRRGAKFKSINQIKIVDFSPDESQNLSKCQTPTTNSFGKTIGSNFYSYAKEKNLIKTSASWFAQTQGKFSGTNESAFLTNKKFYNEVLENLSRQKVQAQRQKNILTKITSYDGRSLTSMKQIKLKSQIPNTSSLLQETPKLLLQKNSSPTLMPHHSYDLSAKITFTAALAKDKVENLINDVKSQLKKDSSQYENDLIEQCQIISDPDFEYKLNIASTQGLKKLKCKTQMKIRQFLS